MKKLLLLAVLLSGCAITDILPEDYNVGDISIKYCETTDLYEKAQLELIITTAGITIGADYCLKVKAAQIIAGE